METVNFVRGQVSSIVEFDFFLNQANLNERCDDDRIAQVIKGTAYERTQKKINEFIARCKDTLAGLKERVDQTESDYSSLVSKARDANPGRGPSEFFLNDRDPEAVAKHNQKIEAHNNKVELHRRLIDQANRSKERYEDAIAKHNDKTADFKEQIEQKLEELKPALDQDILALLGKLQHLAYDNMRNKDNLFAGFLLIYVTKKAYIYLYEYISNTAEQRAATDIFTRLNDDIDNMINANGDAIKAGIREAAQFLHDCHQANAMSHQSIKERLQGLPYDLCRDSEAEVQSLLTLPVDTNIAYKHIIDPVMLADAEKQVRIRKGDLENNAKRYEEFSSRFDPTFSSIALIRDFANTELAKMDDHKTGVLDPVGKDVVFTLGLFDDEDQDRYMKKHKQWLNGVQKEIETSLQIDPMELVSTVASTDLLIKPTKEMMNNDRSLAFLSNKDKLAKKHKQHTDGIKTTDAMLDDINKLPKRKAEEFAKKMAMLLNLSLLPIGNVLVIYPIWEMITRYRPALLSQNACYLELKRAQASKFKVYTCIQAILAIGCGIASCLIDPAAINVMHAVTAMYVLSFLTLFLKYKQLNKP